VRALLERPLDPRAARVIVVLACAVSGGFAALALLAGTEQAAPRPALNGTALTTPVQGTSAAPSVEPPVRSRLASRHKEHLAQDPQDRRGSAAARRAGRELADHRALQNVPYRAGRVAIALVGARGARAVLRVSAPTLGVARRGWRAFLRRYHDTGNAYVARFEVGGGAGG
jgi:hypothetical protein